MVVEEFTKKYSKIYLSMFKNKHDENTLTKLAKFLFEPRYKVNNLQFKSVT